MERMETRVLIALVLSFLVLYVYQTYVVKPAPKPAPVSTQTAQTGASTTEATANSSSPTAGATAEAPAPAPSTAPAAATLVGEAAERDIRVETQDVIAVFTNRGARLKSWRLKKYFDQQKQPQELIEQQLATHPLPFTLNSGDGQLDRTLNSALTAYAVAGKSAFKPRRWRSTGKTPAR